MTIVTHERVRAAIGAMMKSVPGIGIVHPYERYAKNSEGFQSLYAWQPDGQAVPELRGWFIHRRATRDYVKTQSLNRVESDWLIKGYFGWVDARATVLIADTIIEALLRAFRRDPTLGGIVERPRASTEVPIGLTLVESAPYMFGGLLAHGVTFNLTTTHYEDAHAPVEALADLETIHANWELPPRALTGPELPDDDNAVASDHLTKLNED